MKTTNSALIAFAVVLILCLSVQESKAIRSRLFGDWKIDKQCPPNSTSTAVVDVDNAISQLGQGVSSSVRDLRADIEDLLDDNNEWTESTSQYQTLLSYLGGVLKADKIHINRRVDLNHRHVDLDNTDCQFLDNVNLPESDNQICSQGFKNISALLMNFAISSHNEKSSDALYWILQILPSMPQLSNECLDDEFEIHSREWDADDCEDEMEDLGDLIGKLANDDTLLFGQKYRFERIISDHIPKIVAYCFGTNKRFFRD